MMPLTEPAHRSPTGQLVAGDAQPLPADEQIGAYTITGSRGDFFTTWSVTTANAFGETLPPEIMASATTQARARHVAAALWCLDLVSRFTRLIESAQVDRHTVREFFDGLRACLRFADVGPG